MSRYTIKQINLKSLNLIQHIFIFKTQLFSLLEDLQIKHIELKVTMTIILTLSAILNHQSTNDTAQQHLDFLFVVDKIFKLENLLITVKGLWKVRDRTFIFEKFRLTDSDFMRKIIFFYLFPNAGLMLQLLIQDNGRKLINGLNLFPIGLTMWLGRQRLGCTWLVVFIHHQQQCFFQKGVFLNLDLSFSIQFNSECSHLHIYKKNLNNKKYNLAFLTLMVQGLLMSTFFIVISS